MPVRYEIDTAAGLIRLWISGRPTADEFREHFRVTAADPDFRMEMDRILFALDLTEFPSASQIREIANEVRERGKRSATARLAVVANNPLGRGMANMILIQAEIGGRFDIFDDEPSARAWLASTVR